MTKQKHTSDSKSHKLNNQDATYNISPNEVLDTSDPGDETQKRYRYQHAYGIILLTAAMCDKKPYTAIWCEHHEDLLGERPDGFYDGYQIKTQQPNYGLWDLTKEPLKASIKRFVELNLRFPGKIKELFFVSNVGYQNSTAKNKVGHSPIKLLQVLRQADFQDSLPSPFDETFETLRIYCDCNSSALKTTLLKLNLVQGPDLDSFETIIAHEHLPQIQECLSLSPRALATLRDELIAKVYQASSLSIDDPSRHWSSIQEKDHLKPKLTTKRISAESIAKYIHKNRLRFTNMSKDVGLLNEHLEETLLLYLSKSFSEDQVAKLDQAGETDPDRSTLLRQVFVDLELKPREGRTPQFIRYAHLNIHDEAEQEAEMPTSEPGKILSAMNCFLKEPWLRLVLIGGPGQGKSTLGQYLAQVHRGIVLNREQELYQGISGKVKMFEPKIKRIPFRIILKYFAQWLSDRPPLSTVEAYIAEQISKGASRPGEVTALKVQEILKQRSTLVIFDGLDEVTEPELRDRVLTEVEEFLERTGQLEVDIQILATSRPTGYNNQFNPEQFWHLELQPMSVVKVKDYAKRWTNAKVSVEEERRRVEDTLQECLQEEHTRWLLTTPLQVTIVLLIIKDGGRPPAQREALFQNYWTTILRREKSKFKGIIRTDDSLLFNLHAYLGYLLHQKSGGENVRSLLSAEDFGKLVYDYLRVQDRVSPAEALKQLTDQMVEEARYRLVLLVEPEPGLFGFELRSLQEFFAGAYLVQSAINTQQRFERLKAIARSEHWRNVALFFAGRIVRDFSGESANILELVCRPIDHELPDTYLRRGALLALDIAVDGVFAANRNLQYNALEYALTILNTGLAEKDWTHLQSAIKKLPVEDRRDILNKLLKQILSSLPLTRLNALLNLYDSTIETSRELIQGLDLLLLSNQVQHVQEALNLGVKYKVEAHWLATQLEKYWNIWTSEQFIEPLQRWWHADSQYVQKVFSILSFSLAKAYVIMKRMKFYSHYRELKFVNIEYPNSISGQVITFIQCSHNYYSFRDSTSQPIDVIRFKGGMNFYIYNLEKVYERFDSFSKQFDLHNTLKQIIDTTDLLPPLRSAAWKLYLAVYDIDEQIISKLVNDKIWGSSELNIKDFVNQVGEIRPILRYIIQELIKNEPRQSVNFSSFLNKAQEIMINQQLRLALRKLSQRLSSEETLEFIMDISTRRDNILAKQINLPEQLKMDILEMIDTYIYLNIREKQKLSSTFVRRIFTEIEKHITEPHEKVINLILSFARLKWIIDQETLQQGKNLLEILIEKLSQHPHNLQVMMILFFKLLAFDRSVLQYGLSLLPILEPV